VVLGFLRIVSQMPGDDASPLDQVRFLARAHSRVDVLKHLAEEAATQRELRSELDASRTTVSRALQSLADEDWVASENGEYRLTPVGDVVADEFTGLLEAMRTVDELAEFLRWFPADVDAPDVQHACDVEVTTPTDADPYAPARTQTEVLYTADRLRVLLPAIELESTETLADQVTDRGLEAESVVTQSVEATMESERFADLMRRAVETGRSPIYVTPDDLPFYLGLADDDVTQIGLADDDGLPRALLETTDEHVREWGEAVYEDYRESARRKPLAEF